MKKDRHKTTKNTTAKNLMANRQVARVLGHIWKVQLLEGRTGRQSFDVHCRIGIDQCQWRIHHQYSQIKVW